MQQQIPVMLLYVVHSKGSSPGRQGFCMAVDSAGQMTGSVGGGIMEHKFVQLAISKLQSGIAEDNLYRQVHQKSAGADQSGMICSGEQTLLLKTIQLADGPVISKIARTLSQLQTGLLQLLPGSILFSTQMAGKSMGLVNAGNSQWQFSETIGVQNNLIIVGGGHCALALSAVMQPLDFYITLYNDRQCLATFNQNTFAHQKILVQDYTELQTLINPVANAYIIVMTVGYRTDDIAIRALRQHKCSYFGILGSQKKIDKMMAAYRAENWPEELLSFLSAPAGIAIKSQTPEEIAISIAAQIIYRKNFV